MSKEPVAAVVTETVEHGFDWGSAVVGAGSGAAAALLLLALIVTLRSARRSGSHPKGGRGT